MDEFNTENNQIELQYTIKRISKLSIKKERKYIPPRRTLSKCLKTQSYYDKLNYNGPNKVVVDCVKSKNINQVISLRINNQNIHE